MALVRFSTVYCSFIAVSEWLYSVPHFGVFLILRRLVAHGRLGKFFAGCRISVNLLDTYRAHLCMVSIDGWRYRPQNCGFMLFAGLKLPYRYK